MATKKPTEDSPFNPLALDNQLCFALYVCGKEIIKKYRPLLEPLGLTYTGYIVMLALWEKDEITVKELGDRLFLDSGTLTPLLKKLTDQGYLSRQRNPLSEREVIVELTENGRDLREKAITFPAQLLGFVPCAVDSPEDFFAQLWAITNATIQKK